MVSLAQGQGVHFFGPPAVGFGVGLVSVHRKFPVGTSIVSRRSSRSYSHQSFYQATPRGTFCYSTRQYSVSDHFYTARHLKYYQPNVSIGYQPEVWENDMIFKD